MKNIKIYVSIIALITIIFIIFTKPQYLKEASKALVVIMECEQCFSE